MNEDDEDEDGIDQEDVLQPEDGIDNTMQDEEEEEEDECRVCRGPAEEGRPLLQPCKCSGSMGMTHQDCLISWLELKRGDGRCEICKTKFRFDPQYGENAPDRLPAHEVILGLSSRFLAKWLPLALRIFFAAFLWLVVAPYLTNCLYLGWIIKPSSILTRREMILSDIVSGAVMGATIIISFLSLMSFADFLRVLWQRPLEQQPEGEQNEGRENVEADGDDNNINIEDETDGNATDERIIEITKKHQQIVVVTSSEESTNTDDVDRDLLAQNEENNEQLHEVTQIDTDQEAEQLRDQATELRMLTLEREARRQSANVNPERTPLQDGLNQGVQNEVEVEDDDSVASPIDEEPNDEIEEQEDSDNDDDDSDYVDNENEGGGVEDFDEDNQDDIDEEDAWMDEVDEDEDEDEDDNDENDAMPPLGQPPRGVAFDPLDPVLQDDQVDMEINVALDELLGLRGPVTTLVRNLLWLLAFNATYLGIFGFVPKTVGSVIYSSIFNTTLCGDALKFIPYVTSVDKNQTTVVSILSALEQESNNSNTTFKLSDFAAVTLGYLSIASFIVMSRYGLLFVQKGGKIFGRNPLSVAQNRDEATNLQRVQRDNNNQEDLDEDVNDLEAEDIVDEGGIGDSIGTAMDATVAIIKVCVLLFMKMFLLPLSLGLWLDASTTRLFGHDISSRLAFAGNDLFSFILLHWVAGITFMLLVTVFLLQLREVTHPDILARMIRPQEPQPDLLGNLMHETVLTHMKRMLLSLAIYAPLLTLHVTLPVMLFQASGLDNSLKFFRLNFYHLLTPQLQIPLELIIFHLSMLALLERHKNTIGGIQHRWMKFVCWKMGLTEYILPRRIQDFKLIGTKSVFMPHDEEEVAEIAPFFTSLASKEEDVDQFILSNINNSNSISPLSNILGEQRLNGERVLSIAIRSISLPTKTAPENKLLLPTKIGKYRLRIEDNNTTHPLDIKIAFFQEVQGDEIERPPEGWDDLGAGGAFVQGRWAWAKERKSLVEESVAERTTFRTSSKGRRPINLIAKVIILIFLSWVAIIVTGLAILSLPLLVGRSFYYLLRIPEEYIHDPFAFCFGAGIFFPTVSLLTRSLNATKESLSQRCRQWMARFRRPPTGKFLIILETFLLWIVIAPLTFGLSYELVFVTSPKWFSREEVFLVDVKTFATSWLMGSVVLNTWSYLLYFKFFTRRFWTNIGNGILEPPFNEDGNPNPNARNRDDINAENALVWQGKRGRVAKFFKILRSILIDWEWDSVDRTLLIDDFALPATKEIASTLVGSCLSYRLLLYIIVLIFKSQQDGVTLPLLGFVEHGVSRKFLFRLCMSIHLLFQIGSRSRARIDRWFEAAHEAARDDRYLVGEILMNYAEHTN